MIRALKFKRRLATAWVIVLGILAVVFFLAFRNGRQVKDLNAWVDHTEQVRSLIARARLERTRLTNEIWSYRSTHNPEYQMRFEAALQSLRADLSALEGLTKDNPEQHKAAVELAGILQEQSERLEESMKRAASETDAKSADWSLPVAPANRGRELFDQLESQERTLYAARSAAVRVNVQQSQVILSVAGALSIGILLVAGYVIQREILKRARIEAGMREAQDMLGTKYEEQRSELDHVVEDLHAQIRARQDAEFALRRFNEKLEQAVQQRTTELEEANREMEAFSYSVSHDLRAPLRHMDGFSRILLQQWGSTLPLEARHHLERIRGAVTHMSALVKDLLQLSRLTRVAAKREPCRLQELVEEAKRESTQGLEDREIEWRIEPLPVVDGDSGLLRQVFVNLLSNAVKFTRHRSPGIIEVGSRREDGATVIFVRDNGAGFDPRYADKLFGVFQRLHRQDEFEGTGVGLATVYRIVNKHGGRVWAESQPDQGATFYFSLPLLAPETAISEKLAGAAV